MRTYPAVIALLSAVTPTLLGAQIVPIRTVPISQAHQFDIFPSERLGMGGVSIAVADPLLDPFTNPAKGARIETPRFFGSPATYGVSRDAGAGRTLPLAAMTKSGPWFGALLLGLQQVDLSEQPPQVFFACAECDELDIDLDLERNDRSRGNEYAFASLGRDLRGGVSLGGSIFWSGLDAIDGVDMLYAGSAQVEQAGHAVDVRLGALKEWDGDRSLEVVAVYNRFRMTHDVVFLDSFWNPEMQQTEQRPRVEHNLDRTHTWGLHAEYEQPLPGDGWRIGWLATANYKTHPKLPTYELPTIAPIPRDPGHSAAFQAGIGFARTRGTATFGIDLIYEPIWTYTWADAAAPIETERGETIPAGGKTIENHFRFSNAQLRMGVGDEIELPGAAVGLQLGLALHRVHYWLDQHDNIQDTDRSQEERWLEWTPTWGLTFRRPSFEIRYRGSVANGTGRPGVAQPTWGFALEDLSAGGSNILLAPTGPVTLDEVRVTAHQLSLSLPIH